MERCEVGFEKVGGSNTTFLLTGVDDMLTVEMLAVLFGVDVIMVVCIACCLSSYEILYVPDICPLVLQDVSGTY